MGRKSMTKAALLVVMSLFSWGCGNGATEHTEAVCAVMGADGELQNCGEFGPAAECVALDAFTAERRGGSCPRDRSSVRCETPLGSMLFYGDRADAKRMFEGDCERVKEVIHRGEDLMSVRRTTDATLRSDSNTQCWVACMKAQCRDPSSCVAGALAFGFQCLVNGNNPSVCERSGNEGEV